MSEKAHPTLDAATRDATRILRQSEIDNAEIVARHIVTEATGLSPAQLILSANEAVSSAAARRIKELLSRASNHEPLSRILGKREFYGRTFHLNEATLDPRPDSETLIDAVIELAQGSGWRDHPFRFIDIGTGTGCLAITLLLEFPTATAIATDISERALEAAAANASDHQVSDRLKLVNRTSLEQINGPFDLLVSNPPYISTIEIDTLQPQVKDYDPRAALDGGADGLTIYRQIASRLEAVVPHGWAVFEVGATMADDVLNILSATSPAETRTWQDLSSHTRCVAVRAHCA